MSDDMVVQRIGATHPRTGLIVRATLDTQIDPTGIKISDERMAHIHLQKAAFHGEWNYTTSPTTGDKT